MNLVISHQSIEETPARGYTVNQLDATLDGQAVGYIRTSFLHKRLCYEVMPTAWHYMSYHKGWCLNLESPEHLWEKAHQYAKRCPASRPDLWPFSIYNKDIPSLEVIEEDLRILESKYRRKMRNDISRHGNLPITEYIRVEDQFQRQGIGTALYIAMAKFLAETYGLPLYASGLQSPEAQATWKSMRNRGLPIRWVTVCGRKKLVLDYTDGV